MKRINANTAGFTDTETANSAQDRYADGRIASEIDGMIAHMSLVHTSDESRKVRFH